MAELAAAIGISLSTLWDIETERAYLSQERLERYVKAMGVSLTTLALAQDFVAMFEPDLSEN